MVFKFKIDMMLLTNWPVIINGDWLIGVGHHGNKHVQQYDDVAAAVDSKHQEGPESREFLYSWKSSFLLKVIWLDSFTCKLKICKAHQTKDCPE